MEAEMITENSNRSSFSTRSMYGVKNGIEICAPSMNTPMNTGRR
jgi:hypothetical protein